MKTNKKQRRRMMIVFAKEGKNMTGQHAELDFFRHCPSGKGEWNYSEGELVPGRGIGASLRVQD
jgi:hypothetical protein